MVHVLHETQKRDIGMAVRDPRHRRLLANFAAHSNAVFCEPWHVLFEKTDQALDIQNIVGTDEDEIIEEILCVFGLEWGLCYFLYKKKIFFRV